MLIALVTVVLAIALFFVFYLAFRTGLRLGMKTAQGETPAPIRSPVEAVKDIKTEITNEQQAQDIIKQFSALDAYDGWTDEERKRNIPKAVRA